MASAHVNRANRPNTWPQPTSCIVKKTPANTEPSIHGTKRTLRQTIGTSGFDPNRISPLGRARIVPRVPVRSRTICVYAVKPCSAHYWVAIHTPWMSLCCIQTFSL